MSHFGNVRDVHIYLHSASMVRLVFRAALAASFAARPASGAISCADNRVSGGLSYRWPVANPALVAPENIYYSYPVFSDPLQAEFDGNAITIAMPGTFEGGFTLNATDGHLPNETYRLQRIEIRNPGRAPSGIGEVIPHILEVALVHQQVGGDTSYYANVIIPFQASGSSEYDPLFPFVVGAEMPTRPGDKAPTLMSSHQKLNLNSLFGDVTFFNFWTTLPTACASMSVDARQFMRSQALNTDYHTFTAFQVALQHAPQYPPIPPPDVAWITNVCSSVDGCSGVLALSLTQQLEEGQGIETQAVAEFRERKMLMDTALSNLVNGTTPPDPEGNLALAVSARKDLTTSLMEMTSVHEYVNQLLTWSNQAGTNAYDMPAPSVTNAATSDGLAPGIATSPAVATAPAASFLAQAALLSLGGAAASAAGASAGSSCGAADIDTRRAVDPGRISPRLLEAIGLLQAAPLAPKPSLTRAPGNAGLRITAPDIAAAQSLGALRISGVLRPISYAEVRLPGSHALDGRPAAVELQLVHEGLLPKEPAVALALRMDVGEEDNGWIASLLDVGRAAPALAELHGAYGKGSVDRYYRYDGTLASPSCAPAQWFVVEEPSSLSQRQLDALKSLMAQVAPSLAEPHRPRAALVAMGTPRLVTSPLATSDLGANQGRLRGQVLRRRVAV